MKQNKGFTLIELLGAVIIISILALLVFPAVLRQMQQSQKTLVESQIVVIKTSAEKFLNDNKNDYPRNNGTTYCIKIQDLVDKGYLKGSFIEANAGSLISDATAATLQASSYVKMKVVTQKYNYEGIFETQSSCTGPV